MKTVLFVDDEKSILNAMIRLFEGLDYDCLFAGSAEEALEIVRNNEVWVIVSDNMMPGMKGIELLSRIKSISPDTVRIIMTAYADFETAINAINKSEAFRFVTKPWGNEQLVEIIEEGLARYQIIKALRVGDESLYLSIAQTVELKDRYTKGHCDRVAGYAVQLGKMLFLSGEKLRDIKYGSWLHDCGKIGVPEVILNRPGQLTEEEMQVVRQHPLWGAEVARQARMSESVINIIMYHHERFDGLGYPWGLTGEDIPIEARIVCLADVFDALFSDRSYRKTFSLEQAFVEMETMQAAFDPKLFKMFLEMIKDMEK